MERRDSCFYIHPIARIVLPTVNKRIAYPEQYFSTSVVHRSLASRVCRTWSTFDADRTPIGRSIRKANVAKASICKHLAYLVTGETLFQARPEPI
jgi:hypothetical protein